MNSNINDIFRNKIVEKFDTLIYDICKSRNVEKSIYNYIIKLSKNKNIERSWNNNIFRNLYLSKVRSIYSNLKSDSYIQNTNFLTLVKNDGPNVSIVKSAPIPVGGSLVAIGGDQKLVMEASDIIKVKSSAATSIDVALSILEIT